MLALPMVYLNGWNSLATLLDRAAKITHIFLPDTFINVLFLYPLKIGEPLVF